MEPIGVVVALFDFPENGEALKKRYWSVSPLRGSSLIPHNGKVLKKEESCGAGSGNIGSKICGNCDRFLGSMCSETSVLGKKIDGGGFICKDLSCVDEAGKKRKNGESWCVYDGAIGDGRGVVGSRHWRRMCVDGEIKIEACADYRGQICVESEMSNQEKTFSIASCKTNLWRDCLKYN